MGTTPWRPICATPAGLQWPRPVDTAGVSGPTRAQAAGPRWDRVGHGLYAPRDRPQVPEQRIVDASGRLVGGHGGAVSGWGALRWRGATFFDGLADGGRSVRPVLLMLSGGGARPRPGVKASKRALAPIEREIVRGLPVATVQRALFDEIVELGELWSAITAIEMAAAARLISPHLFACYLAKRNAWEGVPLAREAVALATGECRSPPEVTLGLIWEQLAGLPSPLRNRPVFSVDGRLLGIPDLFDEEIGVVGEYDGAHHKDREQHRLDVAREEGFRSHGLGYFTAVAGDSHEVICERMLRTRRETAAQAVPRRDWTTRPPPWWREEESLDDHFERTGQVEALTRAWGDPEPPMPPGLRLPSPRSRTGDPRSSAYSLRTGAAHR